MDITLFLINLVVILALCGVGAGVILVILLRKRGKDRKDAEEK